VRRSVLRSLFLSVLPLWSGAALAAVPLGSDGFVPFNPPVGAPLTGDSIVGPNAVETFDPVVRAQLLVEQIPRSWSGTYRSFDSGETVPVQLRLASLSALGQMVDLRGELVVGGVSAPVQGNLNAESDQLDLLVLCDCQTVGTLEVGGSFAGLQGLQLSGWQAPRLTSQGGRLELLPVAASQPPQGSAQGQVRGLW
jgi:hypothetical protein